MRKSDPLCRSRSQAIRASFRQFRGSPPLGASPARRRTPCPRLQAASYRYPRTTNTQPFSLLPAPFSSPAPRAARFPLGSLPFARCASAVPETRFTSLRNAFLTGLLLIAPLVVTIWAIRVVIGIVGGSITPLFAPYLPESLQHLPAVFWDVVTTVIAVGLITLLGYISRLFLGRMLLVATERFIENLPGIGGLYQGVKQFIATFGAKDRTQFSKVVLVQFPRAGSWSLGFLTNTAKGEPHAHLATEHWAVFIPTCPSPVNGFFMYLPRSEIVELDMPVGDGMKTIISCGAVLPVLPSAGEARAALSDKR